MEPIDSYYAIMNFINDHESRMRSIVLTENLTICDVPITSIKRNLSIIRGSVLHHYRDSHQYIVDKHWVTRACCKIQRAWRMSNSVPEFQICKKRLLREFQSMQ